MLIFSMNVYSQISDEELLSAIRHDNYTLVRNYFKEGNKPNRLYGAKRLPLLHYAVMLDKTEMIQILLEAGADIEKLYYDETPLMLSAVHGKINSAKILIKSGANLNLKNKYGKTASIIAAIYNQRDILDLLYQNKADLASTDSAALSPFDYAYRNQNVETLDFMINIAGNSIIKPLNANYGDGPYLFYDSKKSIRLSYLTCNQKENHCKREDSVIQFNGDFQEIKTRELPFPITIKSNKNPNYKPDIYKGVTRILAIGDLHGGFDEFASFLINNQVIDSSYNWTFGDGHLVVLGDVFDRGEKVTECLWLLYRMETEAARHQGAAHLVLGNHEMMHITGDKRYLSEKYLSIFNHLLIDYTSFYRKNTILGAWLRKQNTVLKLNNFLFVHGGISPDLLSKRMSIKQLNNKIREIINRENPGPIDEFEEFLTGPAGPLWYRGYLKTEDMYYKQTGEDKDFDEKKLEAILNFYKAETIVFANTNVRKILSLYNQKLIAIDIPFTEPGVEFQGLLIDESGRYILYKDGRKEKLAN
jgi:hypothetical protein